MNSKTPGVLALMVLVCTGCAAPRNGQLTNETRALVEARSVIAAAEESAAQPLAAALTADEAVRMALAEGPGARAIWARLGVAEAEVRQSLRPHNPTLGFLRLSADGGIRQTTWSLSQELLDLLFTGYRRRQGTLATRQAMQQCAAALLALETDVRTAFVEHAAAVLAHQVSLREREAAQLSAELAAQYVAAGNLPEIALRREEAAASEAALRAVRRDIAREQALARLLTLIGRSSEDATLRFDTSLRWSSAAPAEAAALQALALQQRLDVAALRAEVGLRREQARHAHRWRWLSGVTLVAARESETGSAPLQGGGLEVQVPVFDSGSSRRDRARSQLALREAELQALEIRTRNDIVALRAAVVAQHEAVETHARLLLQQRERIVQLTQQQADYMLVGTFELIAARERQIAAHQTLIDSVTQLALAQLRLAQTVGGSLPGDGPSRTLNPEDLP